MHFCGYIAHRPPQLGNNIPPTRLSVCLVPALLVVSAGGEREEDSGPAIPAASLGLWRDRDRVLREGGESLGGHPWAWA